MNAAAPLKENLASAPVIVIDKHGKFKNIPRIRFEIEFTPRNTDFVNGQHSLPDNAEVRLFREISPPLGKRLLSVVVQSKTKLRYSAREALTALPLGNPSSS